MYIKCKNSGEKVKGVLVVIIQSEKKEKKLK